MYEYHGLQICPAKNISIHYHHTSKNGQRPQDIKTPPNRGGGNAGKDPFMAKERKERKTSNVNTTRNGDGKLAPTTTIISGKKYFKTHTTPESPPMKQQTNMK